MAETIEKQMDKSIKNKEFEKYVALFGQYEPKKEAHVVYYKTITLLYFLSQENFSKYYLLIQGCLKNVSDYEYVLSVYETIKICDVTAIEELHKKADASYKPLLEKIKENIRKVYEKNTNSEVNTCVNSVKKSIEKDIRDCVYVIDQFKR